MSGRQKLTAPLVITGMHRSGTSYLARMLQAAGLNIGQRLHPAGVGNLLGHFENIDFIDLHRLILRSQDLHEDGWISQTAVQVPDELVPIAKEVVRKNSSESEWGWKDPRTCLFLNFWSTLLPDAKFVFVFRSPWQVFDSILRRGTDTEVLSQPHLAIESWKYFNQAILDFFKKAPERCLIVPVEFTADSPDQLIEQINEKFNCDLRQPVDSLFASSLLKQTASPSYWPFLVQHFYPDLFELWRELVRNCICPGENPIDLLFGDKSARDLIASEALVVHNTKLQLAHSHSQYDGLQKKLEETELSWSKKCSQLVADAKEQEKLYRKLKEEHNKLISACEKLAKHARDVEFARDVHEHAYRTDEKRRIELEIMLAEREAEVARLKEEVQGKEQSLLEITTTRTWRVRNRLIKLGRAGFSRNGNSSA